MQKMTIKKLIRELKEFKKQGVSEDDIPAIKNLCYDFINDNSSGGLEDILYEMVDFDTVMQAIEYKAKSGDLWGVQNLSEGLSMADYYKDNGDYFENIDNSDVEEWLDDLISEAKSF